MNPCTDPTHVHLEPRPHGKLGPAAVCKECGGSLTIEGLLVRIIELVGQPMWLRAFRSAGFDKPRTPGVPESGGPRGPRGRKPDGDDGAPSA